MTHLSEPQFLYLSNRIILFPVLQGLEGGLRWAGEAHCLAWNKFLKLAVLGLAAAFRA